MPDADTYKCYLGDLVTLLLEYAREAKERSIRPGLDIEQRAFWEGKALGRYLTLSTMINQARAFGIPLDEIGLRGLDPENEPARKSRRDRN